MKRFAQLYMALDATTRINDKVALLADYFQHAAPEDAAWAVYYLCGERPRRLISTGLLRELAAREAGIPDWLFDECYDAVGDMAETIALLLPHPAGAASLPLHTWIEERLLALRDMDESGQRAALVEWWRQLDTAGRFTWNKLMTGSFRVGVSQSLVVRALSRVSGVEESVLAHRLMGAWSPTADSYRSLLSKDTADASPSQPYPFFLAYPLELSGESGAGCEGGDEARAVANPAALSALGPVGEWLVEWKWDGIRAQLIRRCGASYLWSRGEELITERFPELLHTAALLEDGTVIDGEITGWMEGKPLPFTRLQQRIGRKLVTRKILSEVPVVMLAFDLLEYRGEDVRARPLRWRRERLEQLLAQLPAPSAVRCSPALRVTAWEQVAGERRQAREHAAEGLMLKRLSSRYGVGRRKGDWWKWKVDPYTVDAVLIYAQRGHGRRASLYTDYTFAVWHQGRLVPFAKAYSGLSDEEIRQVDAFIRANTLERFGPVRTVRPQLVFELAFEAIQPSSRHKSGIAVRFPRIARWRKDKTVEEADSLDTVRALAGREDPL